jgi:hypothetical protein
MNFETKVVNVNDEKNIQAPCVPDSLKWQIPMFGDDNANVGTTPSANSNSLRTRACKLLSVQRKPNKKLKREKRWLFTSSSIITYAINISHMEKEIEFLKMEMTKFITPQMLQNEDNWKKMMIQGQLQLATLFADLFKPKTTNGSGNWLKRTSNDNWLWFIFPFARIKTWITFQNSTCITLSWYNWMINHPLYKKNSL